MQAGCSHASAAIKPLSTVAVSSDTASQFNTSAPPWPPFLSGWLMVREKLVSILTPVKRRTHRCFRDKTGRPETSQGGVRKQEEAAWKKRGHLSAIALIHHNSDVEQALAKTMKRIEGFGAFSSPVTSKPNVCLDMDVTDIATTRL